MPWNQPTAKLLKNQDFIMFRQKDNVFSQNTIKRPNQEGKSLT
jgi:hypothetical protein